MEQNKEQKNKFLNIQKYPFELSKDLEKDTYKLQKIFFGNRFQYIFFKDMDILSLAYVLARHKLFRKEFRKQVSELNKLKNEKSNS